MRFFSTKSILFLIIVLALILRFWQLGKVPPGLFLDEASNGYNAYSILKTAKDEYGNFMPATFRTFGYYNPAFSVYMLVPSIAVFGLNEFAVRFPSALLGVLTVPFLYFLVKQLLQYSKFSTQNSQTVALLSAFFLAISPWHIQFSRYDHEANFMLTFSLLGIFLFLYSLKKPMFFILSSLSFAIALNSYHGAKILIPIQLGILAILFAKELLQKKRKLAIPLLIILISALPAAINLQRSSIRGQDVGIFNQEHILGTFISNYLYHFSPNFLFTEGDTIGRHSVSGMGQLFAFQAPLIILGLLQASRLKGKGKMLLFALLATSAVPAAIATPAPHALRSIMFAPLWAIITGFGLFEIFKAGIGNFKKLFVLLIIFALGLYNAVTYLHLYYIHEPKLKARDWASGYREMVEYVNSIEDQYSQIAVTNYFGGPYIFVLFYTNFDPKTYQAQSENKMAFGKYEFFSQSWEKTKEGKALLVTPHWQSHPPKVLKEIYASNGDLTFIISETE